MYKFFPFTLPLSMFIGMPGWHLRDKKGCDLPGSHNEINNNYQPVQLLVLSDHIRDAI